MELKLGVHFVLVPEEHGACVDVFVKGCLAFSRKKQELNLKPDDGIPGKGGKPQRKSV